MIEHYKFEVKLGTVGDQFIRDEYTVCAKYTLAGKMVEVIQELKDTQAPDLEELLKMCQHIYYDAYVKRGVPAPALVKISI